MSDFGSVNDEELSPLPWKRQKSFFPQKPLWPRLKLPVYVLVLGDKEFNSIIAIKKETNNFVLVFSSCSSFHWLLGSLQEGGGKATTQHVFRACGTVVKNKLYCQMLYIQSVLLFVCVAKKPTKSGQDMSRSRSCGKSPRRI